PPRAPAATRVRKMREIEVTPAESALGENDGDLGAKLGLTRGRDHHAREARRQRQLAKPPPLFGDAAFPIDGTQFAEQSLRLRQRRCRRVIQKGKRPPVRRGPQGGSEPRGA